MNTQLTFDTFKASALEHQPVHHTTKFGRVKLLSHDTVEVDGHKFPIDSTGLDSMGKLVKMPTAFANHVERVLGEDSRIKLVNAIRSGMDNKKDVQVTVSLNKKGEVIGLTESSNRLSINGFFNLFDRMVDRYGLGIDRYTHNNGTIKLTTKLPNSEFRVGSFKDEAFVSGLTFELDGAGMAYYGSFYERLICTNGMIGEVYERDGMTDLTSDRLIRFFNQFDELAKRNFVSESFASNVERAMKTRSSLAELEQIQRTIADNSTQPNNPFVEWFIPLSDIVSAYRKEGYDPSTFSAPQKRNAATNVTVWDAINVLTDFASHDQTGRGFEFNAMKAQNMMSYAGKLLNRKAYDVENFVPMPRALA